MREGFQDRLLPNICAGGRSGRLSWGSRFLSCAWVKVPTMTNFERFTNLTDMTAASGAHFNSDANAVVVEHLPITDKDAVREAQRWTTGERGPIVEDPALLGDADLTAYVSEAIVDGRVG